MESGHNKSISGFENDETHKTLKGVENQKIGIETFNISEFLQAQE